jgi:hypothetical protein
VAADSPVYLGVRLCPVESDAMLNLAVLGLLDQAIPARAVADDVAAKRASPVLKKPAGLEKRVESFLFYEPTHGQKSPDRRG